MQTKCASQKCDVCKVTTNVKHDFDSVLYIQSPEGHEVAHSNSLGGDMHLDKFFAVVAQFHIEK